MKRIPVWKNVILIVSVLVVIVVATLAWFYTGPKGSAEGIGVHVGRATYLQVSGPGGSDWSDDLDVPIIGVSTAFKEISGDGSTFFAPDYETDYNDNDILTTQIDSFINLSDLEEAEKKEYYYEEILHFRSDVAQDVYLTPESYVAALGEARIDAAVRLAFFELDKDGNETLKFIWAPNSTAQYSDGAFYPNGSVEEYYCYQKSATIGDLVQIPTNGAVCGYDEDQKFMWSNEKEIEGQELKGQNLPTDVPPVLTVDELYEDGHFHKSVKVRVWLEGCDRECVSKLSGQQFTIKLQFTIAPEENNDE